jgi:hypothetical protein
MTTTRQNNGPMATVYFDEVCCGFILRRGRDGVEAFTSELKSLGLHPSEDEAVRVVWSARQQS